jgi:hypothetical protein
MEGGAVGHNFERDPPRDHPCQVWFNLVQRYISAERKISQKNQEYMLNYSLFL